MTGSHCAMALVAPSSRRNAVEMLSNDLFIGLNVLFLNVKDGQKPLQLPGLRKYFLSLSIAS